MSGGELTDRLRGVQITAAWTKLPESFLAMSMRFTEIGQQLRAYRLESGLRAEEIAARLGVSRAALYRYEKGEVIKLDTVPATVRVLLQTDIIIPRTSRGKMNAGRSRTS